MNKKRFFLAGIAVFIAYQIVDFIIHTNILSDAYQQIAQVWRADMMGLMWVMHLAVLLFSFIFVYVFIKGYEAKGIMEGIRFGLIIGLLMKVPTAFSEFVIYPIPLSMAVWWAVLGTVQFIICGIVVSLIYKPKK